MKPSLERETEKLTRAWLQHDASHLRDYLVAGVEDPRINFQSVLSRHFILCAVFGDRFAGLMEQEHRFSAVMNWLLELLPRLAGEEDIAAILHALSRGADNAEGLELPQFVGRVFASLPAQVGPWTVPNYLENSLRSLRTVDGRAELPANALDTFFLIWKETLARELGPTPISVLEPACGSANDARFLSAFGLTRLISYTGFDLCEKNVANARLVCPEGKFEIGNVFSIPAPDAAFDLCFVHDLFEHLSPEGLPVAIGEVCRVTRQGICAGFFQMDEIPDHIIRPVEDYYWNTLSMDRVRELFERQGFTGQVIHVGSYLRQKLGCEFTHNPNAYTLVLERK
jgi:SAM-dependent methyltransferase